MHKGIYFDKSYNLYHARYYANGKYHHIGRFATLQEAVDHRTKFIKRYFNA